MVEWVQPKAYDRWKPPTIKLAKRPEEQAEKKPATKKPTEKKPPTKAKGPVKEKTPEPEGRRARPHPGKAGEIEGPPKEKGLVPIKDIPPGPRVPTGPSRPQGSRQFTPVAGGTDRPAIEAPRARVRTMEDVEASQKALGELVKSVMDQQRSEGKYSDRRGWRDLGNLNTGSIHTGEIVEPREIGGRTPLGLPTRQTASTEQIQRVRSQMEDTAPIRRDQTRELPTVGTQHDQTIDFQAIAPARTPFAVRNPLPVGGGRTPEQLAMFHVPGGAVNPTLSTRQNPPIALPGGSAKPGKRVTKLSARPMEGKKPGDQGTLFQPARYRSVT